ncbi:A24 family peptidase [uncultured Acetatifactor sp.]|uniref:prepilin peptidase n=1 Tax=uncultured Acetatifactor sp. TaxID=1671927 RepID=UPI0026395297|nr:A24 family peptidase [uncultured Acetatifactor sp.]
MERRKMDWNADTWNLFLTFTLLSMFAGLLCDMAMRRYLKETEELHMTAGIGMAVTAVFIGIHGFTPAALRCVLLCYVLVLAGAADIATHEIPDALHLLVAMAGLIGLQPVSALLGFLLVPLPFLMAALKTGKIGGGDVKLMAASGFALGVSGGFWMMFWGLLMALLWNASMRKGREDTSLEKSSIPLAPFLAFGCFVVLLPVS